MAVYSYSNDLLHYLIGCTDVPAWVIGAHLGAYGNRAAALQALETSQAGVLQLRPGLLAALEKLQPEGSTATALAQIDELTAPTALGTISREQVQHLNAARWAIKAYESKKAKRRLMERLEKEGRKDWSDPEGRPF